jgi:hypothetical protein
MAPFLAFVLLAGCATHDDARLQGTWHSNRDATVAAFQRDPRWTNAPPEKVQRFEDMFGQLTITYSNGVATSDYHDEDASFHYKVVKRGSDYDIIRYDASVYQGRDIKIRFVDEDNGYWIDTLLFGIEERFDKVATQNNKAPEPTATVP